MNINPLNRATTLDATRLKDTLLLSIMAVGAGCGMIYEYLAAHYAGRILGTVDTAIYGIIGLMVVSMGIGAFYSRQIRCPYTGFAWLEALIAIIGGSSVLFMASLFALAYILPGEIRHLIGLHESINVSGGFVYVLDKLAASTPYLIGFLLGFLVGMEIPLIARMREDLYQGQVKNNAGTVYGIDYIGGGIGALVWVLVCLKLPIIIAAVSTALLNLILGAIFLYAFRKKVAWAPILVVVKLLILALLVSIAFNGKQWMNSMNSMLYRDQVVLSHNSRYQNLVLTERVVERQQAGLLNLFINGRLQFSSADEKLYHQLLTYPAMLASQSIDSVLMIGGGDGLGAREVLANGAKSITLIDLDPDMIRLFKGQHPGSPAWLNARITQLNHNALNDERMHYRFGDAFKVVEEALGAGQHFDMIIVDLPDPSHPDLNKLYSAYFYRNLSGLLNAGGALAVQSTSPYHSKKAFISIGKTVASTGMQVNQYHANIPSFGEWGWTIATKVGKSPLQRIYESDAAMLKHSIVSKSMLLGAFAFTKGFFKDIKDIEANQLYTPTLYGYHVEGWRENDGVYRVE